MCVVRVLLTSTDSNSEGWSYSVCSTCKWKGCNVVVFLYKIVVCLTDKTEVVVVDKSVHVLECWRLLCTADQLCVQLCVHRKNMMCTHDIEDTWASRPASQSDWFWIQAIATVFQVLMMGHAILNMHCISDVTCISNRMRSLDIHIESGWCSCQDITCVKYLVIRLQHI